MAHISSCVSFLPMLSLSTSGLNQTCSFLRKKSFPASRTIRGKVTKPTHHQAATNLNLLHPLSLQGSRLSAEEKIRAMSFGCCLEELRVMVLLTRATPALLLRLGEKGSLAESE